MAAEPTVWVVDASVAFAWFAALLAPDLVLVELLNAGWKSLRLGAISAEQFQMLMHRGAEPFSHLAPCTALLARASHWCLELDHPAYDCLYVALAEREKASLISADQRLLRKLKTSKPGLPAAMGLARLTESRQ